MWINDSGLDYVIGVGQLYGYLTKGQSNTHCCHDALEHTETLAFMLHLSSRG